MKNSKKIMSIVAGVAMASQLLTVSNIVTFAETNDVVNTLIKTEASADETNDIANTSTEIENPALSENEITLSGVGYTSGVQSFKLKFDTEHKKLKAEDLALPNNAMHSYFGNNEYIELELIGQDGEVKDTFSMTGNDKVDKVKEINQAGRFDFQYGDKLVIHHAEADWRTKISGNIINNNNSRAINNFDEKVSKEVLNNNSFELTPYGLKEVSNEDSNVVTIEGIGCDGGTHGFEIKFDNLHRRLEVKTTAGWQCPIEPYYKDENYVTVEVVNEEGNKVNSVTLKGDTLTSEAEKKLDGCPFKTGYGLRIRHAEAGPHVKVKGTIDDTDKDFTKEIDKELVERITFREGKDRLYYEEAQKYPDELTFKGRGCQEGYHKFKLKFNERDMRIKVSDIIGLGSSGHHEFHSGYGDGKYIQIELYGSDEEKKASVTLTGNDNVSKVVKAFNNRKFEYGDYLKIYHREGYQRLQFTHTSSNSRSITGDSVTDLPAGEYVYKIASNKLIPIDYKKNI